MAKHGTTAKHGMTKTRSTGWPGVSWRKVMALAAVGWLSACGGAGLPVASVSSTNTELQSGYVLAAGDSLRVNVFDEPTLTGEYKVGLDGQLALPLLQAFDVDGQTSEGVAETIAEKLRQGGYVLEPKVSVEIMSSRPFYILGEVNTPGKYPCDGKMTLSQAIAVAGGYTARANKRTIVLQRYNWGAGKRVKLDNSLPLKIFPGDTITVQEAFF